MSRHLVRYFKLKYDRIFKTIPNYLKNYFIIIYFKNKQKCN